MKDSKVISLPNSKQIEEEAADWIMRLDDGDATLEEQTEFRAWFEQSDQHRTAIARMNELWGGLDCLESLNDIAASDDVVDSITQKRAHLARWRGRKWAAWSVAASLVLVSVALLFQQVLVKDANFSAHYQTAVGEQLAIDLPDGSHFILNTGSKVEVNYSGSVRAVFLASGEAFFEVAKDHSRPFSVRTDNGSVTAVGTAFSVSLRGDQVGVVVTEGRVALSPNVTSGQAANASSGPIEVLMEATAGQSVAFSEKIDRLEKIELAAIEQHLDWRDGILSFKGESLEQVVADISPYTSLNIEIEGEALKQQPIGGYFKVGETEALFEALKLMANVKVERLEDERIRLYR